MPHPVGVRSISMHDKNSPKKIASKSPWNRLTIPAKFLDTFVTWYSWGLAAGQAQNGTTFENFQETKVKKRIKIFFFLEYCVAQLAPPCARLLLPDAVTTSHRPKIPQKNFPMDLDWEKTFKNLAKPFLPLNLQRFHLKIPVKRCIRFKFFEN